MSSFIYDEYFQLLMISADIHCHSYRSYVSCWLVVSLFVFILAEMYCIVRLVLADSLICCANPFQVIVIYQSHSVTLACVDRDSRQSRLGLTY